MGLGRSSFGAFNAIDALFERDDHVPLDLDRAGEHFVGFAVKEDFELSGSLSPVVLLSSVKPTTRFTSCLYASSSAALSAFSGPA